MKRFVLSLFLMISLLDTSCTGRISDHNPESTITPTPINSLTASQISLPTNSLKANITPSPTSTQTEINPVLSTPTFILPIAQELCPSKRYIPLSELGLSPTDRLVLIKEDLTALRISGTSTGYWLLSDDGLNLKYLTKTEPDSGAINKNLIVSPNGKWMIFTKIKNNRQSLWLSSIDGVVVKEITDIGLFSSVDWINDQQLAEIGILQAQNYLEAGESPPGTEYIPLSVINPFLNEKSELPEPYASNYDRFLDFYFMENSDFIAGFNYFLWKYDIFNYTTGDVQPAFQWLTQSPPDPMHTGLWFAKNGLFYVVIEKENRVDTAVDLDFETVKNQEKYDEVMKSYRIPEEFIPFTRMDVLIDRSAFLFYKIKGEVEPWQPGELLFALDYANNMITNYCLDVYPYAQSASLVISPNEKFLAFTSFENPIGGEGKKQVEILNMDTGFISVIPGYQIAGWGSK